MSATATTTKRRAPGLDLGIAPTPHEVILERGPMRVLRYRPDGDGATAPIPVLLVPSIINRSYIFDLREGQSVVAALLERGLAVYLVDWGFPTLADRALGIADYAGRLLRAAMTAVRADAGADRCHLFGYCLGGTFSLIADASRERARPGPIAGIVALTTPVDLAEPGRLGVLTDRRLVDVARLARALPIVPGELLWAAFQSLDPVGIGAKWRGFAERAPDDPDFVARFRAQERWVADPVPMTARALGDLVTLYRENPLVDPAGLALGGRRVRLADGHAPVLNVLASADGIVPASASRALHAHWGGPVETVEIAGGHLGVCVGSKAPGRMWKVVGDWLLDHQ